MEFFFGALFVMCLLLSIFTFIEGDRDISLKFFSASMFFFAITSYVNSDSSSSDDQQIEETEPQQQQSLQSDLNKIAELKSKLNETERKLIVFENKNSHALNEELRKLNTKIASLNQKIEYKDYEILVLKNSLERKDEIHAKELADYSTKSYKEMFYEIKNKYSECKNSLKENKIDSFICTDGLKELKHKYENCKKLVLNN